MNCNCNETYKELRVKLRNFENDFQVAFGKGPASVIKLKLKCLDITHKMNIKSCNCFIGQNLYVIKSTIENFFKNKAKFQKDNAENVYIREVEKTFDKIVKILYNIADASPKN